MTRSSHCYNVGLLIKAYTELKSIGTGLTRVSYTPLRWSRYVTLLNILDRYRYYFIHITSVKVLTWASPFEIVIYKSMSQI